MPYTVVVEPRRQPGAVRQHGAVGRLRRQRLARPARRHRHQRAGQRRAARRGRVRPDRRADSAPRPAASASSACCSRRPVRCSTATTSRCRCRWSSGWPTAGAGASPTRCSSSNYVGIGNPDARRVWLDNDPRADYGEFIVRPHHVLAASATWNPWRSLTVATVVSAISGAPINETVGRDVNGDLDNNDRPIRGIDDLVRPIRLRGRRAGPRGAQRHSRARTRSPSTCRSAISCRSAAGSTASTSSTTCSTCSTA